MATFKLNKGQSFQIQKEIQLVHSGLVWDPPEGSGPAFDLDVHCFALVHPGGDANRARLYNEGSHALCYAFVRSSGNPEGSLIKNADGSFQTDDGSMWHERDDRTGRGGLIKRSEPDDDGDEDDHGGGHHDEGFREEFKIVLAKLPGEVSSLPSGRRSMMPSARDRISARSRTPISKFAMRWTTSSAAISLRPSLPARRRYRWLPF